ACARGAFRPDAPAVAFDQAPGDVKAETQAAAVGGAGLREAVEDCLEAVGGNSGPCVTDGNARRVPFDVEPQRDGSTLGGELDGVGEQICDHLHDAIVIDARHHRTRGNLPVDGQLV